MLPQHEHLRRTSPRRLSQPPGPPPPQHTVPQQGFGHHPGQGDGFGSDCCRRLQEELAHKDQVLKQLEVQFELYKEEHAKLLASKIEEQREAFNLEKDRINQHFIRTGQELHGKTDELHQQIEENTRLANENKNLKDWLDQGVEECRRVAEENERLKNEIMESRGAIQRSDADMARRLATAEMERDHERGEKEAAVAAMQALQARIRELEVAAEEDRRNFHEVATQARRMRRRMLQLKSIVDRFCGEKNLDALGAFDDADMIAFEDIDAPEVMERQTARDALFHLHEAVNSLQASCRKMTQPAGTGEGDYDPNGFHTLRQQVESLKLDKEALEHQLRRKQEDLVREEEMLAHTKERYEQRIAQLEEELDRMRREKMEAVDQADSVSSELRRLQNELEQARLTIQRLSDQDAATQDRAQQLEEDLRKLSQEMIGIRDYGLQLERQNADLEREVANLRDKNTRGESENSELNQQLQRQIEEQRLQYQDLQDKCSALQEEVSNLKAANAVLEERARALAAAPPPPPPASAQPVPPQLHPTPQPQPQSQPALPQPTPGIAPTPGVAPTPGAPNPTPSMRMHWPAEPDDYGHASPAHVKLACPLCATEGFMPGVPCRNCGHSVGQFTRLMPSMEPASAPHTPANYATHTPTMHLQPPTPAGGPNRVSPVRWQ